MKDQPMNNEFTVHVLSADGIEKAKRVADDFNSLLNILTTYINPSREFSIVRTKLEEACFFAKKAIAGDKANQKSYATEADEPGDDGGTPKGGPGH